MMMSKFAEITRKDGMMSIELPNGHELIKALDRIEARLRAGWMQHAFARDQYGEWILANDPGACRFCLVGAIAAESKIQDAFHTQNLMEDPFVLDLLGVVVDVAEVEDRGGLFRINDTARKEDVLAIVAKAKGKILGTGVCDG